MEKDCCFTEGSNWFRYRAAAIIIEEGCVLVAGNEVANYYYSIGGGVQLGETAEQAVVREVFEETGVHYDIDRLAFIHENFFPGDGSIEGFSCHEIAFYFLMKPRGKKQVNSTGYCTEGKEEVYWIPIDELANHAVFPTFYAEKLRNLPQVVEHIVTKEVDTIEF